jgi:hypothetical protein
VVRGSELERVIPGGKDEAVTTDVVLGRRKRHVEEAHGAVRGGGRSEGLVRLGPRAIEECVRGGEGEDWGLGSAGFAGGEDKEVVIADEPMVLRCRHEKAVLVEGAEPDGEPRSGCLERLHHGCDSEVIGRISEG